MEKLQFGETAVLEDGKEYVCFCELEDNGNSYVYLVTASKPVEVCFAKQRLENDNLVLDLVSNQNEKEHLLALFQEKMGSYIG